jgi:hypothetical protein
MQVRLLRWCFVAGLLLSVGAWQSFGQTLLPQPTVPFEWLTEKTTVEEVERLHPGLPNDERVKDFPEIAKPFGFLSRRWDALKARMQSDDELWWWSGPTSVGIALVRSGKVIDFFETAII